MLGYTVTEGENFPIIRKNKVTTLVSLSKKKPR